MDAIMDTPKTPYQLKDITLPSSAVWHKCTVSPAERAKLMQQTPRCIWLTGLSGAGKSTVANALDATLHANGVKSFLLDGDNVRHGLNKDLGMTENDRAENIRRVGERSEEHTSELQSRPHLVCRLLLEKKKNNKTPHPTTYHECHLSNLP